MDLVQVSTNTYVVIVSAIGAAASFVAVAVPLLNRKQKQERYREVIEKKRREVFEQAREQVNKPHGKQQEVSAAQSVATLYRLQRIAGEKMIKPARTLMQAAGKRDPNAPLTYLISRIVLPLVFVGFGIFFMSQATEEFESITKLWIIIGLAAAGFYLPYILIKNQADKRQQDIALAFPDSLDMMLICVQGGIGIEAAINRIADTIAGHSQALAEELGILCAELGMMNDRKSAFMGFASRVGSGPARSFATAMLQAEQYGTSISKALRVLAEETRGARMAAAEQKAASLPPKLTVPMIVFFLPCLFVVILGPAYLTYKKMGN